MRQKKHFPEILPPQAEFSFIPQWPNLGHMPTPKAIFGEGEWHVRFGFIPGRERPTRPEIIAAEHTQGSATEGGGWVGSRVCLSPSHQCL